MKNIPPQHQARQPGSERGMVPHPESDAERFHSSRRFAGKSLIVTGGDSGIGRAVAIGAAREGANVAIVYLNEDEDAHETEGRVQTYGGKALSFKGDVGDEDFCKRVVDGIVNAFGPFDVLVNNAGEQHPQSDLEKISASQLERTFRTNIFGYVFMAKAALPHMRAGGSIVNIASVTAYKGSERLIDYSATKGAIVSFTRALSNSIVSKREIRVNCVAPGPIWTPLIPASFSPDEVAEFGKDVPMGRPGQPDEVAAGVLFLASDQASYISGQTLHINGGVVVGG